MSAKCTCRPFGVDDEKVLRYEMYVYEDDKNEIVGFLKNKPYYVPYDLGGPGKPPALGNPSVMKFGSRDTFLVIFTVPVTETADIVHLKLRWNVEDDVPGEWE